MFLILALQIKRSCYEPLASSNPDGEGCSPLFRASTYKCGRSGAPETCCREG